MIIWALIPAHNEEREIAKTIKSLQSQTIKLQRIVVIADNCTDNTIRIAEDHGIDIFITKNNKNKKAGAYNQFLRSIKNSELICSIKNQVDFLLLMDADTIVSNNAIEVGIKHFKDRNVSAVCSKAGVQSPTRSYNFIENFLYRLQKIEYGIYDSQRVQTAGRIKVVHGMAALHRWEHLKEAQMFNEDNITEDYYLTLMYKKRGHKVMSEIKMMAWTIVPIKIMELCKQRIRWNRGGVDALRNMGWNKGTYKDILQHIWGNIIFITSIYIYARWIFYIFQSNNYKFSYHWSMLVLIIFCIYDIMYRIKNYVDNLEIWDWLTTIILMPLYNYLQKILLYISYLQSFMKTKKTW